MWRIDMKEISAQIIKGSLHPISEVDKDTLAEFKENQIVNLKITGTQKARSIKQLGTYFAGCKLVSKNTDDQKWNTYQKTDYQLRNRLQFYDHGMTLVINGNVQFKVRSISFKNLKHIEANNYFGRAFETMAKFLGVTVEVLMEEIKSRMVRRE